MSARTRANAPATSRAERPPRRAAADTWRAAIVPAVLLTVLAWRQRWNCDDAFIIFRVVDHVLAGHGPVFNVGERVEAYTDPAWMALLVAWRFLGAPLVWGAVLLGLALTLVGLVASISGALRLARPADAPAAEDPRTLALPLGALVLAVLPPQWDFTTSGLETGMVFAWLGVTFRALAGAGAHTGAWTWRAIAVLCGVGPLIRPDLAVFSAAFLTAALIAEASARGERRVARAAALVGWALALPLAYQVFRMGYFGALVPNSGIAKEAGLANIARGWAYALDFARPYALVVPLAALAVPFASALARAWRSSDRVAAAVLLAPVVGALLHAGFVVRVGGDFMHARLLLPALWGALLPVAAVRIPWGRPTARAAATWGAAAAVIAWAALCAFTFRVRYDARGIGPQGIADERAYYVHESRHPHPVTASDYAQMPFARDGADLRAITTGQREVPVESGGVSLAGPLEGVLMIDLSDSPIHQRPADGLLHAYPLERRARGAVPVVVGRWNIGLTGYLAGDSVHVVDRHGLADPIAARLRTPAVARPGHTKQLRNAWIIARYSQALPADTTRPDVESARRALDCPPLVELLDAVEAPLTPARFMLNLQSAARLTALRIPPEPAEAERELCNAR